MKKCNVICFVLLCAVSNMLFAATDPVSVTTLTSLPATTDVGGNYPIKYQLTNNLPITVTNLTMTPSATNATYVVDDTNTTCSNNLGAYQSCIWAGTFSPTAAGSASAAMQLKFFSVGNVYNLPAQTTTAENATWLAIVTDNNLNEADNGVVYASASLTQPWHEQSVTSDNAMFTAVDYHNGLWVLAGGNTTNPAYAIFTSTDATHWTARALGSVTTPVILSIAYGNGKWVALGIDADEYTALIEESNDGVAWTRITLPTSDKITLLSVYYAANKWVAVGSNNTTGKAAFYTSIDAETSTLDTSMSNLLVQFFAVTYGNNHWVALGKEYSSPNNLVIYTSSDAITWQPANINPSIGNPDDIYSGLAYGNNEWRFVVGAGDVPLMYKSVDVDHWSPQTWNIENFAALQIKYLDGYWLLVGAALLPGTELVIPALYMSTDGSTWTKSFSDANKPGGYLFGVAHSS
jgi:hypothetical protein